MDDAEILDLARVAVGSQFGLTPQQSARLRGDTAEALKADARLMQAELGIRQFDDRDGIDVIGVLRALPYDLTHLSFAQGASTITEQVAKVLYLGGNDHSPWRKLEDAAVAWKLENRYTRGRSSPPT